MNKQNNHIILIGLMGCGKSTLGKKIASKLNYDFVDTDEMIEKDNNKSISSIFSDDGEAHFRALERECISKLNKLTKPCIISTGGGMPCFFDNMDQLLNLGICIFIDLPLPLLVDRLFEGKTKRPILAQLSKEEILQKITDLDENRRVFYSKAQIHLHLGDLKMDSILDLIKNFY